MIAAVLSDSLGRVRAGARQPTVDAVVVGFGKQLEGLATWPPRRPADAERRLRTALLWGRLALNRSRDAIGYAEVTATVEGVLQGLLFGGGGPADG